MDVPLPLPLQYKVSTGELSPTGRPRPIGPSPTRIKRSKGSTNRPRQWPPSSNGLNYHCFIDLKVANFVVEGPMSRTGPYFLYHPARGAFTPLWWRSRALSRLGYRYTYRSINIHGFAGGLSCKPSRRRSSAMKLSATASQRNNYPIIPSSGATRFALIRARYCQTRHPIARRASPTFTALSTYAHIPCRPSGIK